MHKKAKKKQIMVRTVAIAMAGLMLLSVLGSLLFR